MITEQTPVSYTHLDVYKRQIFPPPGFNKGDANFDSQLQFNSIELQPRLK